MPGDAKPPFEIRAAQMREAAAICEVLRRSIVELCVRDHRNDPSRLAEWLADKTPEHVANWIADPGTCTFVAANDEKVHAVGSILANGEIALNYVAPDGRFQGISRSMLQTLEQTARELGHRRVTLTSTFTAHDFYISAGYADDGTRTSYETGDWPHMQKELA
jgi:GNAT superfamily N-acetyltransferase